MTEEELLRDKPRGQVTVEKDGKKFQGFICHGCQSCWFVDPDSNGTKMEEYYPHWLFFEEVIV